MKNSLLYSGIALSITGIISLIYAGNYTYIDANNVLHDTLWLPLGWLMFFAGLLLLIGFAIKQVIGSIRSKVKN